MLRRASEPVAPPGPDSVIRRALPLLPVALAATVYYPIIRVYFFADDFMHLLNIADGSFARFVLQPFGGHVYVARNAVFYLSYLLFGLRSEAYYAIVLFTHLANVWLIFRVIRSLTGSLAIACFGAALWGASPLQAGALGWYSVYGQVLSATVLLVVFDRVAAHVADAAPVSARVARAWCFLLLVGATCFGVGIAVALAFPAVLALLLPPARWQRGVRATVIVLPLVTVAMYVGLRRLYYTVVAPMTFDEFITMYVALSRYSPILDMTRNLLAFGVTKLLLGFSYSPASYPGLTSHIVVAVAASAVLAAFVLADGATRRRLLAFLGLALATYGLIGVGRANLLQMLNLPPQVAATEARYHYAASVPLTLALCTILAWLGRQIRIGRALASGLLLVAIALHAYAFGRSDWTIQQRSHCRAYIANALREIDAQVKGAPAGRDVYIPNPEVPRGVTGPALSQVHFPGWAGVYIIAHHDDADRGHRVYFVESNRSVLTAFQAPGSNRLSRLLVSPEGAAQASGAEAAGNPRKGESTDPPSPR